MRLKKVWLTSTSLLIILLAPYQVYSSDNIKWLSYNEGIARAKAEKKVVFLHFYTDWCRYCKIMANSTFKDSTVINFLNDNFVSVRVNGDKDKKLVRQYGVSGYPNSWFLNTKGEKVGPIPGYIQTKQFLKMIQSVHSSQK